MKTIVFLLALLGACGPASAGPKALKDVRTFMVQIQGLEKWGAVDRLADSDYDMLVIDSATNARGGEGIDMRKIVAHLRAKKPGRIVLAYLDLGAAETDRTYWYKDWKAPTDSANGHPNFLLGPPATGWSDTYPVAYWDGRWIDLMVTGNQSVLKKTLAAGFDGVWLDWVQAYRHPSVIASAQKAGVDPAREMINLLAKVREQSRAVKPAALVVALNCPFLVDSNRALLESIDALAIEGIWFSGKGDVAWDSAEGGDIPNSATDETSTPARLAKCAEFVASGKPVFTVDYCLKKSNAQKVYAESKAKGFVPLVTQSSMAKMTSTPPSR